MTVKHNAIVRKEICWTTIELAVEMSGGFIETSPAIKLDDTKTVLEDHKIGFMSALENLEGCKSLSILETLTMTMNAMEMACGKRCTYGLGMKSPWHYNDDGYILGSRIWRIGIEIGGMIFNAYGLTPEAATVHAIQALTGYVSLDYDGFGDFSDSFMKALKEKSREWGYPDEQ